MLARKREVVLCAAWSSHSDWHSLHTKSDSYRQVGCLWLCASKKGGSALAVKSHVCTHTHTNTHTNLWVSCPPIRSWRLLGHAWISLKRVIHLNGRKATEMSRVHRRVHRTELLGNSNRASKLACFYHHSLLLLVPRSLAVLRRQACPLCSAWGVGSGRCPETSPVGTSAFEYN